jgi:hypothetical protein
VAEAAGISAGVWGELGACGWDRSRFFAVLRMTFLERMTILPKCKAQDGKFLE